jgi:hypothetical protein
MTEASGGAESARGRWAAALEAGLALLAFAAVVSDAELRALLVAGVRAMADGARSSVALMAVDPPTVRTTLAALARVILLLAPVARALALGPRRRLCWLPLGLAAFVPVFAISLPALSSPLPWALCAVAAALGWLAAARPGRRIAALLPWMVALEPTVGHTPLGDVLWPPARLARRCEGNDGVRPRDLHPGVEGTRYYAVTPATPERLLLTGESRSFWVRRTADGAMTLGPAVKPTANLWQGCVRDGAVWVTARGVGVCKLPIPSGEGEPPPPTCYEAPGPPGLGLELDYVDALCPADRPTLYASQLLRGGYLELDPRTGRSAWHRVIPGLNLQLVARSDGRLVGITTSRLVVFDPNADRVLEEHPAGAVAMGLDVCAADQELAVTDFAGRLRLFERGPDGRYRFRAGVALPAPRRVAFSPGCERLLVTSGDDRHAFLLRRSDLAVLRRYRLGPGLRDVVFLDERNAAAADACTINLLDAGP